MRGKECSAFPHYCRGRQGTDPPAGGGRPDGICRPSSKGVTAVFCEPEAEKNSVRRGIIPLWKKRGRTDRANHQTPALHFREGAFVGEPQVPTTFERSAPAGSSSLAFPGSGVGLPGCVIPPG